MKNRYPIESATPFSESLIWQLNRDYYQTNGIEAWRTKAVPHHLTSSAMIGRTYAELIFSFLRDLAAKGKTKDTVYILELGAGHGRLAFHILKQLDKLTALFQLDLPPYCYVLSDIVEDNLNFFFTHPQYQAYLEKGLLDVAYFDGVESESIDLRYAKKSITVGELNQPIIAIANYFFDSIPNDLFHLHKAGIDACSMSLESKENPEGMDKETLTKHVIPIFHETPVKKPFYKETVLNEILDEYQHILFGTYLFFPHKGLQCLTNLRKLSKQGLMLLSMDKGFHEIHDLEKVKEPEIIKHGSCSVWVNYHAFGEYCKKHGGKAMFPMYSTFHIELACLLMVDESEQYTETTAAYERFVNDFGPDDLNSIKRLTYQHISKLTLLELTAIIRLTAYDSTIFQNILPRLRQVISPLSANDRRRFAQTMHKVWEMYFTIFESFDMAYELGGIFYDLGYYPEASTYFKHSERLFGLKADIYYNLALCHYQLREDALFTIALEEGRRSFPDFEGFKHLDKLDLAAV